MILDEFTPTALPALAEEAALASDALRRLDNEVPDDAEPEPLEKFELLAVAPRADGLAKEAARSSDALRRLDNEVPEDAEPEPLENFELLAVASRADALAPCRLEPVGAPEAAQEDRRDLLNDQDWAW